MEFRQIDKPALSGTSNSSSYTIKSSSSTNFTPLKYLELAEIQKAIKSGIIKRSTDDSGGFGTITEGSPIYIIDDSGFIFTVIDSSGNSINVAAVDTTGKVTAGSLGLMNGDKIVNLSVDTDGNLLIDGNIYSTGEVSSYGSGSGGGGSGVGIIQNVLGYTNIGGIFSDSDLTTTFNAYTINELWNKINNLISETIYLKEKDIELQAQITNDDSDKYYQHIQNMPSNIWTINHNLDKYPSCTIIDSAGYTVEGEIKYIDSNNLTITFNSTFSGKVNFN